MCKFLIPIFIILLFIPTTNIQAAENIDAVGGESRDYYIGIELSQWGIELYDLNLIEDLMLNGLGYTEALQQGKFTKKIGFAKNSIVHLQIFSLDVQHGISIPQLNIQEAIERRDYSIYTFPVFVDFTTPNQDTTYELSCNIYCGLGHSNMKFKFVFGEGSKDHGEVVFLSFIALNLFIIILYSKKLLFDNLEPFILE